jgi:hypothetical protein
MLLRLAQIGALVLTIVTGAIAGEPPRGSPERAAVLDALRPAVERDLGPPVMFRIERMNVEGAWAFVSATPMRNGEPLDWSRTRFAKLIAQDAMSDAILALLRRGPSGAWRVVEYALGPTDVTWEEWIPKHRLSRSFFLGESADEQSGPATPSTPDQSPFSNSPPVSTTQAPKSADPASDVMRALDAALGAKP